MGKSLVAVSEQLVERIIGALPEDAAVTVALLGGAASEACGRRAEAIVVVAHHDGSDADDATVVGALSSLARVAPRRGLLRAMYVGGPGAARFCAGVDRLVPLPDDPTALRDLLAEDLASDTAPRYALAQPGARNERERRRSTLELPAVVKEPPSAVAHLEREIERMRAQLATLTDRTTKEFTALRAGTRENAIEAIDDGWKPAE
jgi:hypothetical protein